MKDIKITEPIAVTLKAAEWYYLIGVLEFANHGENPTLDKLYAQVMDVTE